MGSCCIAQGAQLRALWWPRKVEWGWWEGGYRGSEAGRGYMYVLFLVAQSCLTLCNPMDCSPPGCPWRFSQQKHRSDLPCPPQIYVSVQSLSHVWLSATPWIAACQASLSITNTRSLVKLMFIKSVMPSNHPIFCRPLLLLPSIFPSIRVFPNESVLHIRWQSIGVSASASVLPMNIQD